MKQILFMMPSYYHFDEVVKDGLVKYSNCKVNGIDTVSNQAYRHLFDRAKNFLSKVFLNKNLKFDMRKKLHLLVIDKYPKYDYLIVNRPDTVNKDLLVKAVNKSQKKILLLWDSLAKVPISEDLISLFDVTYSFDIDDCKKYNFQKIENFHFFNNSDEKIDIKYDIVFLGTLDKRIGTLKKILDHFNKINKNSQAFIYVPPKKHLKKHSHINILTEIVPFKESVRYARSGEFILDIAHENQKGLSFRVFEAMQLQKKLITTNKQIREYEFYNENNIFVIEDVDNISIPHTFWNLPYIDLPADMVEKYNIKNWVKRILNE